MQDHFTGKSTRLCGAQLPNPDERAALLGGHRERLRALDQLVEIAGECGIRSDKDRDFAILPEDEVSLLELAGGLWARLGEAIRRFRELLPFVQLDVFGFKPDGEDIFDENAHQLVCIGRGVEAMAFQSPDASIYKFFYFREGGDIGSGFSFGKGEDGVINATAVPGNYRGLLAKLLLIQQIGMPTEVLGITREGIVVAKQALGETLAQGADTSKVVPGGMIVIPSRFLRANRDHPRLYFLEDEPWLVADLHARNFVRGADGELRVIDLVAALWPAELAARDPLLADWLERVRKDPNASALPGARDDEL